MAENASKIIYELGTVADNTGLVAHTNAVRDDTRAVEEQTKALREQQSLSYTPGNRDLASSFIGGDSTKAEAYVIKNQKEYETAQGLIDRYQKLLLSKQLLGIQDEALVAKIAALDAALSTESALRVAEKIETDAVAAAALKDAEAKTVETAATTQNAAAQLEDAEATTLNATAKRELLVVMRELMSGNITRLPGSLSILAGSLGDKLEKIGLSSSFLTGIIMPATIAFFAVEHLVHSLERTTELLDEQGRVGNKATEWPEKLRTALPDVVLKQEELRRSMEGLGMEIDPVKQRYQELLEAINHEYNAADRAASAHRKLENARLDSFVSKGKMTTEQAAVIKLELDEREFEAKLAREKAKAEAILKTKVGERDEETANADTMKALYDRLAGQQLTADAQRTKAKTLWEEGLASEKELKTALDKSKQGKEADSVAKGEAAYNREMDLLQTVSVNNMPVLSKEQAQKRLEGSTDKDIQAYLGTVRNQELLTKQKELNERLEKEYMGAALSAQQADDAAKLAGDGWREAVRNIAALNREIKQQTTVVNNMVVDNANEIKTAREITWQEMRNKFQAEYEKAFNESKKKGHENDPKLIAEMQQAKVGLDYMDAHKPRNPFEYVDTRTGRPTGMTGVPPQKLPDIPPPDVVVEHLKKVADAYEEAHKQQVTVLNGIVDSVNTAMREIREVAKRQQTSN